MHTHLWEQFPAMFCCHGNSSDDVIHCLLTHEVSKAQASHTRSGKEKGKQGRNRGGREMMLGAGGGVAYLRTSLSEYS